MIDRLNKAFESRVRLGVMSALLVNDWVDHTTLKQLLNVTDGNLASHLTALHDAGYVQVRKRFVANRPNTSYKATASGTTAFRRHLDALEQLIKNT